MVPWLPAVGKARGIQGRNGRHSLRLPAHSTACLCLGANSGSAAHMTAASQLTVYSSAPIPLHVSADVSGLAGTASVLGHLPAW